MRVEKVAYCTSDGKREKFRLVHSTTRMYEIFVTICGTQITKTLHLVHLWDITLNTLCRIGRHFPNDTENFSRNCNTEKLLFTKSVEFLNW